MANPLDKLLRAGEGRILRRLNQVVKAVNALEDDFEKLTDDELQNETTALRERYGERRVARQADARGIRRRA